MAHIIRDQSKLLNRVRRIRGQVEAIERALERKEECSGVLRLIAATRGAINGLMAEVLEGHVRYHVIDPAWDRESAQLQATEELLEVVRAYLK